VGTLTLVTKLDWDRTDLERVVAHLEGKGLVALSDDSYIDGRRVRLTADGMEAVEWSLLHPAQDPPGRSSWVVTWLYVVDLARSLTPETLDALIRVLRESPGSDVSEIGDRVERVAGTEVWAGLKRLFHDPAFGQTIPAWIAVLLAILTLVQGCRQEHVDLDDAQRQTVILKQAVQEAVQQEANAREQEHLRERTPALPPPGQSDAEEPLSASDTGKTTSH
jgi:hypothetical protein